MNKTAHKYRKSVLFLIKFSLFAVITAVFILIWYYKYPQATYDFKGNYVVGFSYALILVTFLTVYGSFRVGIYRLWELCYSFGLSLLITNFIMYFQISLIAREMLHPGWLILAFTVQCIIACFGCFIANKVYFRIYKARPVLAVCNSNEFEHDVFKKFNQITERYKITKVISAESNFDILVDEISRNQNILFSDIDNTLREKLMGVCYEQNKRVYILPKISDVLIKNAHVTQIFDTPVFLCKNRGPTTEQLMGKRVFDVLVCVIGIIVTTPIMIVTAIAIKAYDGGPVLFSQERFTLNKRKFKVLKFRSMRTDAEKNGAVKATKNDDRITAIGKVIRMCRIDELPQLFNILKGDMSIVGPRPERIENADEYAQLLPEFSLRNKMKAGLTGYAQIFGKYNTTPQDKLMMDLLYIEQYSFLLDIKLIVLTLKIIFLPSSTEGFLPSETKE
ncbi:MAG: exopolysaccharide biosynthesis polyprenyl glycosylphosphotransferase [Oscillospiraceae bacterium]